MKITPCSADAVRHKGTPCLAKYHHRATVAEISDDALRLNLCIALVAAGRWARYGGGGLYVGLCIDVLLLKCSTVLHCMTQFV